MSIDAKVSNSQDTSRAFAGHSGAGKVLGTGLFGGPRHAAWLAELADWVRDVLFAWPATQRAIPRCWSRHWDVIAELSALYCAWHTAYLWEERTDHHSCEYLDRWLPGALERLAVQLRPCAESHQPDGGRRDDAELVDRSIAELRRL